jgi:L-alanine-DL-glutamate epimerase-like enolase superfamily enzyme
VNVALVEPIVVNVAYRHRELSSIVARDGVTDVLVRITTDDGLVGWGESTSTASPTCSCASRPTTG